MTTLVNNIDPCGDPSHSLRQYQNLSNQSFESLQCQTTTAVFGRASVVANDVSCVIKNLGKRISLNTTCSLYVRKDNALVETAGEMLSFDWVRGNLGHFSVI